AIEQPGKAFEFMVDGDAQGLKGPRRRMNAAAPIASEDAFDEAAQLAGGIDRTAAARFDDRAGDTARSAILAILENDSRQLGLGLFVDDVIGAQWLAAIHAHIERPIEAKAEAAIGIVEGKAAHAEVGDDRVDAGYPGLFEDGVEAGEIGLAQGDP